MQSAEVDLLCEASTLVSVLLFFVKFAAVLLRPLRLKSFPNFHLRFHNGMDEH
jgi:hypothetical protein